MPLDNLETRNATNLASALGASGYATNNIACPVDGTEMRDVPDTSRESARYGSAVTEIRIVCPSCGRISRRYA